LTRFVDVLRQPTAPVLVHVRQARHRRSVAGLGSAAVPPAPLPRRRSPIRRAPPRTCDPGTPSPSRRRCRLAGGKGLPTPPRHAGTPRGGCSRIASAQRWCSGVRPVTCCSFTLIAFVRVLHSANLVITHSC
jgi:hypothetical protein